jgi:mannose-6-phosphate isomerase-like protein (cupin superfamily)
MKNQKKDQKKDNPGSPEFLSNWPFPNKEKRTFVIKKDDEKTMIYGKGGRPIINTIFAATDKIYFGEYSIKPGSWFEPPDIHAGDEVYYCLSGTATIFDPIHGETVTLNPGDGLLIPMGTWHVGYNFGKENFRIVAVIAPKAWSDLDVNFEGKQSFYKDNED